MVHIGSICSPSGRPSASIVNAETARDCDETLRVNVGLNVP